MDERLLFVALDEYSRKSGQSFVTEFFLNNNHREYVICFRN
jgi:hypothetical protein